MSERIREWIYEGTVGLYQGQPEECLCSQCHRTRTQRRIALHALAEALFGWLP